MFVWLIELSAPKPAEATFAPLWWTGKTGCAAFGTAQQAVRFARKEDADAVRQGLFPRDLCNATVSTEHGFHDVRVN